MSKSVYEMVTDRIMEQLENNIIPWQKPWAGIRSGAFNRISKKPYSLLNQMLLKFDGEYASYKQWQDIGGHVRKGAKSEIVVFWKIQPVEEEHEDGTKEVKQIPFLRYYNVFHISQVDGVEPLPKEELNNDIEPIEKAENILYDYWTREDITVEHKAGDKAYYSPNLDLICLPLFEQFTSANEYYSTAYHESIHSTMKESRCNRAEDCKGKLVAFGSEYGKEELVAEIGSANLMNIAGIETSGTFRNSTAYIQSWLSVLRNDTKFIVSASSKAEKAVKYILGET